MAIEKIMKYECRVCGRNIEVTRSGDLYEEPVYCCGLEATEVNVPAAPPTPAAAPRRKPVTKKKAAKKAKKKAVKKKAAKKKVAKKKATKKKAARKKAVTKRKKAARKRR